MSEQTDELAAEQEHLERAWSRLEELRERAIETADAHREVTSHHQQLYERDVLLHSIATRYASLTIGDEQQLIFGRTDDLAGETLHIGRVGLRDEDLDTLVVDWRAPAAEAFYRATYADPHGLIRRRTILTRGRRVIAIEDQLLDPEHAPDDVALVGDAALLAAVTRSRAHHMRDIAATIQAEQDRVIRQPEDVDVIVSGGPGTGKTAVALHRVAYLLYSARERIGRRGALVIGPNRRFVDYIDRVLPSLGEDQVVLLPITGFVSKVDDTLRDPPDVAALKGDPRMAQVVQRLPAQLLPQLTPEDVPTFQVASVSFRPDPGALQQARSRVARPDLGLNARRQFAADRLAAELTQAWSQAAGRRPADANEVAATIRTDPGFDRLVRRFWPLADAPSMWRTMTTEPERLADAARGVLDEDEIAALVRSFQGRSPGAVGPADAALVDELFARVGPRPRKRQEVERHPDELSVWSEREGTAERGGVPDPQTYDGWAHIVIDEAQDLTPMQWRMLARRSRAANLTIVGDPHQTAADEPTDWKQLLAEHLDRPDIVVTELSTNYRTPARIVETAARILRQADPDAEPPLSLREGDAPEVVVVPRAELADQVAGAAQRILARVDGTAAVIAPLEVLDEAAAAVTALLGGDDRLAVVDPIAAKGLEWDGVVVADPEAVVATTATTRRGGLRTLYVAMTRATHHLIVVAPDDAVPEALSQATAHPRRR
ncbi:MAG: AAA family ATPase [Actinobacteria bacterium]|nr:AAA family ATPase [Actinomycetota bacterium]